MHHYKNTKSDYQLRKIIDKKIINLINNIFGVYTPNVSRHYGRLNK